MNWTLIKSDSKFNRLLWIDIYFVLSFYMYIIISMFDPNNIAAINDMINMLPATLMKAIGFAQFGTDLTSFIGNYIYGMLIYLFPMIYVIIVNNRLVAKYVDKGSMAYLLSTPNSRLKVVISQAVFSLASITLLLILMTGTAIGITELLHPGYLNIGQFIILNVYTIFLYTMISGVAFFSSCLFNETKHSLSLSSSILIGFYVLKMIGDVSDKTTWVKNLTIYSLFDPNKIFEGHYTFMIISSIILLLTGLILYIAGIVVFHKKDLPL